MGVSVGLEEMYSVQVKHIERIQNESSFFFGASRMQVLELDLWTPTSGAYSFIKISY